MAKYVCSICGYVYDEAVGVLDEGILPETKWEDVPNNWTCPLCNASKEEFNLLVEDKKEEAKKEKALGQGEMEQEKEELRELSFGQMSTICSNLARGCEKQYLQEEAQLFLELADYYKGKAGAIEGQEFKNLLECINKDLEKDFVNANDKAHLKPDRGALRALVWSEKVSKMLNSFLKHYEKEKDAMLEHTNVYVCDICGFLYIGDELPQVCPVCKVTNKKMIQIERR